MHPKIGIIICGFNENRQFVPNVYIQSVRYAKGIPLLIPLVRSDRMIDDYVSLCDGFLLRRRRYHPSFIRRRTAKRKRKNRHYGRPFSNPSHEARSGFPKTVLAICRGMQILNVSCGGTIWQDLSLIPQPTLNHTQQSASRGDVSHRIKIERCSKLKQFVGSCIYVNSFHHQSVKTPGRNVCVSARSPDGVIEAIELSGHPFALGVQWHPECMYRTSPEMRSLFHEFIAHSLINSKDSGHTIS